MAANRLFLLLCAGLFCVQAQAAPKIESWTTRGGAKVLFVAAAELPMVDIRVVFDAGSARDGDKPGLASFTSNMLTEGAGDWSADDIALRTEERGIQLGTGSLRDMGWASVRSLTDTEVLDVAVATLNKVLTEPTFAQDAMERIRERMQIAVRRSKQSPAGVAEKRFMRTLYADHPYAHPPGGEQASLAEIGRDDLVAFHRKYYASENAIVAIVGALDRAQAEQVAERALQGMLRGSHAPALPAPPETKGGELRETFPSSQTHILVGQKGMQRHDPDYFPLYVGNHVLGGGSLVSILGDEVRHKRGLSYSVYSYFSPMRSPGPFLMVAQTKNTQADQALDVMRDTLKRFISAGPTADQLARAKQNIIGGFPLRVSSNGKIVEYIAMMGFYDYPLDWLDTLVDKVDAVTAGQVRSAFRRRISPDANIAVIVGGGES